MNKHNVGIGTVNIRSKTIRNVVKVLETSRLSSGDITSKFENKIAKLHNRKFAIFCNSGTSALQISLSALKIINKWNDGDEVIVPSITFIATSNVVIQNNMKPVFIDVEDKYFSINPELIESKISRKTRAIIPVHLFGQSADMDKIVKIAKKHNLKILEDSCETMFVRYNQAPVGSKGDIACFSTYATHLITTGVGGLAMTNDSKLALLIKSLINHGRDSIYLSIDDDNNLSKDKLFEIVPRRFSFTNIGYSYRLTEIEACLGLGELEEWKSTIRIRKRNAFYITKRLEKWQKYLQLPSIRQGSEHAFMLYPIVINNSSVKRERLLEQLEGAGIETRFLMPLLNQPVYKKLFGDIENNYPVAKHLNKNGFIIGCHQDLSQKDLDHIINTFDGFFRKQNL